MLFCIGNLPVKTHIMAVVGFDKIKVVFLVLTAALPIFRNRFRHFYVCFSVKVSITYKYVVNV